MATYAIGDIQGCYQPLMRLLDVIEFKQDEDTLWFTGDLVNRGPQSLTVLRFVHDLGDRHQVVLGNHDLHLLAAAHGHARQNSGDTIDSILHAKDREELINWLQHRPLMMHDEALGYALVHAGLAPQWTVGIAKDLAGEVEAVLRSDNAAEFFKNMYGNHPSHWSDELTGMERLRCIVNYFTRMRYCHEDGSLDLNYKGEVEKKPEDLIPWFDVKPRASAHDKIIFGHWAALGGETSTPNVYPLDTGCVWGNQLTAMRVEDGEHFSIPCT